MQRRTTKHTATIAYLISGAALLGLAATACNPSPHLDPAGSGGSGATGGTPTTTGGGNGNYVKMQHDAVYTTGYLHMSRLGEGIVPGKRVHQGDVIGYVGMTGLATGPHTCLRFYKNGAQVDFQRQGRMPAPGVPAAERKAFDRERDRLMARFPAPAQASPLLAVTALPLP